MADESSSSSQSESIQTDDASEDSAPSSAAHCETGCRKRVRVSHETRMYCPKHGGATITVTKTPKKPVEPPKPPPTTLQQLVEREVRASHSLDNRQPDTAYILCSDGTLATTKGGKLFGFRNLKPHLAAIRDSNFCTLPIDDGEHKFTYAYVTPQEGYRLRDLMKELCGMKGVEECTLQECHDELSLQKKHAPKPSVITIE